MRSWRRVLEDWPPGAILKGDRVHVRIYDEDAEYWIVLQLTRNGASVALTRGDIPRAILSKPGFAAMDPQALRALSSKGGVAVSKSPNGKRFNSETARQAALKQGKMRRQAIIDRLGSRE